MNIHELYRRTDRRRKFLAKYVRLLKVKTGYNQQGQGFVAAQTQSTHTTDARDFIVPVPANSRTTYVSLITFKDSKLNVNVQCSCSDFTYRLEVALHNKWDAAEIEYSNGELPNVTNPRMAPYLCKHLCAVYVKFANKIPKV